MRLLEATLCLLRKDNQILLAKKKRGFGEGKYNGVGGKLEKNETPEMAPEWFSTKNIPYNCMFPDDKYWLPLILEGKKIKAYFQFDKDWNLLSHQVEEL